MTRRSTFRTNDLARALAAAQKDGLQVSRIEIDPSGKLTLTLVGDTPDVKHQAARQSLDELRARLQAERDAKRMARSRSS